MALNPAGCLREDGGRLLLRVAARPGASRSVVQGVHGDALKVAVGAQPERGKANKALCVFVAKQLGLRSAQVTLVAGPTSRAKTLALEGITRVAVEARLRALLAAD